MKKFLISLILFNFCFDIYANEVEVIELHESISLDQMVLQNQNNSEEIEEDINDQIADEISVNSEDISQVPLEENEFWNFSNLEDIKYYLTNSKNIKSNVIKNEFYKLLEDINLDYNQKKNRDIFYSIIKFFYETGNISRAYDIISSRDISKDEYVNFYKTIEINYFLSTFNLEYVCNFKNDQNLEIQFNNYLLEKIDIFCLVLENKFSEADLLNSILIESETEIDTNFQKLFSFISSEENKNLNNNFQFDTFMAPDLIFLYSAMARIAELPLDEKFLEIDSENLAIPIILNKFNPIELRIKAANKSYLNGDISIDSLAALYQSVDFDSNQLDNPKDIREKLQNKNELLMAYYFQFINIQFSPSERMKAIINFWDFAKEAYLEEIAYAMCDKIIQSVEFNSSNAEYSHKIATALIFNKNYDLASKWIEFHVNTIGDNQDILHPKILLELYSTNDVNLIINLVSADTDNSEVLIDKNIQELLYIMLNTLGDSKRLNLSNTNENVFDDRQYLSLFLKEKINQSINDEKNDFFLIYTTLSMNNKEWKDIHPEHLKLILTGYLSYKNGNLLKEIMIEIFENYNIL